VFNDLKPGSVTWTRESRIEPTIADRREHLEPIAKAQGAGGAVLCHRVIAGAWEQVRWRRLVLAQVSGAGTRAAVPELFAHTTAPLQCGIAGIGLCETSGDFRPG